MATKCLSLHVNENSKFHNSSQMTLTIEKLSQRTGDKWVLKDVSFAVDRHGIFGVFGPAGSGKTALLRAIAGKVRHNGGSVTINGNNLAETSASKLPIVYHNGCDAPSLIGVLSGAASKGSKGLRQIEALHSVLSRPGQVFGAMLLVDRQRLDRHLAQFPQQPIPHRARVGQLDELAPHRRGIGKTPLPAQPHSQPVERLRPYERLP